MVGQKILHYEIITKLGEGGMGLVYKAEDTKLKRTVALKFLPRHIAENETERERFKIEAQAAAALNHPNIATIYAIEEAGLVDRQSGKEMFIVMEYIEGQQLRSVTNLNKVSNTEVIDYAVQIAEGLNAAHKKGIVHRDIKSSNIMITYDGQVKILDFGLAKIGKGVDLTKEHSTAGTLAYMSPEQIEGRPVDARSDIFSFGVVLYEMLTGHLPFQGEYESALMYSILNEEPAPIASFNSFAPKDLVSLVGLCLQKDVRKRCQSVSDIIQNLRALSEARVPKTPRTIPLKKFIVIPILVVLLAALFFLYIYRENLHQKNPDQFIIAVTRFSGPENESNTMQNLIRTELLEKLGAESDVGIIFPRLQNPLKTHEEAKQYGKEIDADLVIWGDVLTLYEETEIQVYLTFLKSMQRIESEYSAPLSIGAHEDNHITLRRIKAKEVSTLALLVAARYYAVRAPDVAFSLLEEIQPPTVESLRQLGQLYKYEEKLVKSEEKLKQALDLEPHNTKVLNNLGYLYSNYKYEYDAGIKIYAKVLSLDPENIDAKLYMAECYARKNETNQAITIIENLLAQKPDNVDLYSGASWVYWLLRSPNRDYEEKAKSLCKRAIQLDPTNEDAYFHLGMYYEFSDSLDLAINYYKKAINAGRLNLFEYSQHVSLARVYSKQGKNEKAINEYQIAISLAPRNYHLYYMLSSIYAKMGEKKRARDLYERASIYHQQNTNFHHMFGHNFLIFQGDTEMAMTAFQNALKVDSLHQDRNRFFIGLTFLAIDSLKQAMLEFEKVIATGGEHMYQRNTRQFICVTLIRQRKFDDALKAANDYIEFTQEALFKAEGYGLRAVIMFEHGDFENMFSELQLAIDMNTFEEFYYRIWYFLSLHRLGRSKEADSYIALVADSTTDTWRQDVLRFFQNEMSEKSFLKIAAEKFSFFQRGQIAEANYYVGMAYLLNIPADLRSSAPDTMKARSYFKKSAEYGLMIPTMEGLYAWIELERLQKE